MSNDGADGKEQAPASNKKMILIFAVVALVLVGAAVGGTMFFMGGEDHGKQHVAGKKDAKRSKEKGEDKEAKAEDAGDEEVSEEDVEEGEAEDEEEGAHKQAFYSSLAPAFVVNFQGKDSKSRFLKVELDVVAREEESLEAIKTHMPKLRNNLVLLFSRQIYEDIISHEGKERLRAEALTEIQKVLKKETGKKAVEDVFFTSFVMQ
jgi:flagellar FliL protein